MHVAADTRIDYGLPSLICAISVYCLNTMDTGSSRLSKKSILTLITLI